jgi:acyl-CoA hydrolase
LHCLAKPSVPAGAGGFFYTARQRRIGRLITAAGTVPIFAASYLTYFFCMMRKQKPVKDSFVIMTELVLPNDTNTLNNLMGGRMMHLMDIAAAIAAQKHSNRIVVTASVDNVSFREGIRLGNVVTLQAQVTRAFASSMEVHIDVWAEDIPSGTRIKSNEAFFTFVAVDQSGRPIDVPEALPETPEEIALYDGALRRRQLRLVLGGRMKPEEATELKALFAME